MQRQKLPFMPLAVAKGFTLAEVMIVVAIIAVLAATLFPVLRAAKRRGQMTVTLSNLRQCGLALHVYADDYGGDNAFPATTEATASALPRSITCDPADYWRHNCEGEIGAPMVGSYAYRRLLASSSGKTSSQEWADFLSDHKQGNIMACIFYASPHYPVFVGEAPPHDQTQCGSSLRDCMYPDRTIMLRLDTSAWVRSFNPIDGSGFWLITWSSVLGQ